MMIVRRPNNCESIEIAPGPRRMSATATIVQLASNNLTAGSETRENATAAQLIAANTDAIGVKNPMTSRVPLAISATPVKNAAERM
jgi:hypothetical protein